MSQRVSGQKLKLGIVGAGKIVEDAHLPVLRTLPNVSIAWITDQREDRRELISQMYQIPAVSPEVALHQIQDIDVCLLAIPFGVRREYLDRCVQYGTAIYVEKPFARSEAEHIALMSQLPSHKLAVGFQRREYQAVQTLQGIIRSGMLGELQSIHLTEANFTLSCGGAKSFRTSASHAGGGITIESSIHSLDLIQYLTSASNIQTFNVKSIVRDGIDYQMQCDSRLTVADGREIPVSVFISRLKSLPDVFHFQFENAVVDLPTKPQFPLLLKSRVSDSGWHAIVPDEFAPEAAHNINKAFALFWERFLNGMQNETANLTSACTSVMTSRWIEQIYGSMMTTSAIDGCEAVDPVAR